MISNFERGERRSSYIRIPQQADIGGNSNNAVINTGSLQSIPPRWCPINLVRHVFLRSHERLAQWAHKETRKALRAKLFFPPGNYQREQQLWAQTVKLIDLARLQRIWALRCKSPVVTNDVYASAPLGP